MPKEEEKPLAPLTLTDVETAYIAGFMDGEGMVTITKHYIGGKDRADAKGKRGKFTNYMYGLVIKISNSHRPSLEWIAQKAGGWIVEKPTEGTHRRRHYVYCRKGKLAQQLLERMLPFLIVKKEQAEVGIEFQKRQSAHKNRYEIGRLGPVPRTPDEIAYKEHAFHLLQKMKRPSEDDLRGPKRTLTGTKPTTKRPTK